MPAQTALVLNTKSYAPRGKNSGDIASWALVGDTSFGGATSTVSERVIGPDSNGNYRISFKLILPKAATADSPCGCVGSITSQGYLDIVAHVPQGFTVAERDDFTKRAQSLVASAIYTAAQTNLEGSW